MALFALLLADEIEVKVDRAHVLALILVHDLVEIYAGDSYAFDYADDSRHATEAAAAERLFGMLPADLGAKVKGWWLESEEALTPEARFAKSLDRLQAFSQSILSSGRDWREHGTRREQTYAHMEPARAFDPYGRPLVRGGRSGGLLAGRHGPLTGRAGEGRCRLVLSGWRRGGGILVRPSPGSAGHAVLSGRTRNGGHAGEEPGVTAVRQI